MDAAWLDRWVGAAVAAALTVGATVAWDARARRRALLDESLTSLATIADELGTNLVAGHKDLSADAMRRLTTALLRPAALAGRPVGLVPAKYLAPLHWRLTRQIESVTAELAGVIAPKTGSEGDARAALATLCATVSNIALMWWRRPLVFFRREPIPAATRASLHDYSSSASRAAQPRPRSVHAVDGTPAVVHDLLEIVGGLAGATAVGFSVWITSRERADRQAAERDRDEARAAQRRAESEESRGAAAAQAQRVAIVTKRSINMIDGRSSVV